MMDTDNNGWMDEDEESILPNSNKSKKQKTKANSAICSLALPPWVYYYNY